mmetsp:Transcript_8436/g.21089  ORF Transcript_8436/g.21089 Transcript_8436/m.21089 type:complete len:235 (+) Transcript_8436:269-973(+)
MMMRSTMATMRPMMHIIMRLIFCVFSARSISLTPSSTLTATVSMLRSIRSRMVPCSTTSVDRSRMICASSAMVSTILRISASRSCASVLLMSTMASCALVNPGSTSARFICDSLSTSPMVPPTLMPFCASSLFRKRVSSLRNSTDSMNSACASCRCTCSRTAASSWFVAVFSMPRISVSNRLNVACMSRVNASTCACLESSESKMLFNALPCNSFNFKSFSFTPPISALIFSDF